MPKTRQPETTAYAMLRSFFADRFELSKPLSSVEPVLHAVTSSRKIEETSTPHHNTAWTAIKFAVI